MTKLLAPTRHKRASAGEARGGAAAEPCLLDIKIVIAKIDRAILTLRSLSDHEYRWLTAGSRVNWPAYTYDAEDRRAQSENPDAQIAPERHRPTRRDIAEMDEPLEWFRGLNLPDKTRAQMIRAGDLPLSPEQRLIWWSAVGLSDRWVAKKMGVHHETARRRTAAAYERLWGIANAHARRRLADAAGAAKRRL